ncbi:MAG: hypothetical protein Q8J64_07290, partial [Thermodesulfovibrionales bacterium]|nr:hypothetical protein [Thermodesulfovibrionales bacterium]
PFFFSAPPCPLRLIYYGLKEPVNPNWFSQMGTVAGGYEILAFLSVEGVKGGVPVFVGALLAAPS